MLMCYTLRSGMRGSPPHGADELKALYAHQAVECCWKLLLVLGEGARRFDPVFTQLYPATSTLRPLSLWQAIGLTGAYPELEPPAGVKTETLTKLVAEARRTGRGPIVVFPEGTTSNGRALLKFVPVFTGWEMPVTDVGIHILAFRCSFATSSFLSALARGH